MATADASRHPNDPGERRRRLLTDALAMTHEQRQEVLAEIDDALAELEDGGTAAATDGPAPDNG